MVYETLFSYPGHSRFPNRCWLRLFHGASGWVAILAPVPGAVVGPSHLAVTALVQRLSLPADRLTVIESHDQALSIPPLARWMERPDVEPTAEAWLRAVDEGFLWDQIELGWDGVTRTSHIQGRHRTSRTEVEQLVGEPLAHRTFWYEAVAPFHDTACPALLRCEVGERWAEVSLHERAGQSVWDAVVHFEDGVGVRQADFAPYGRGVGAAKWWATWLLALPSSGLARELGVHRAETDAAEPTGTSTPAPAPGLPAEASGSGALLFLSHLRQRLGL